MELKPGKYHEAAVSALEETQALGVVLLVLDGNRGSGIAIQGPMELQMTLPGLLRAVAMDIENDLKKIKS